MSDDHNHRTRGRVMAVALTLTTAFAAVEALGGWLAGSLALLSDAGHMLTDSSSLAIGAFAAWLSRFPASRRHSFGLQRAEVLGALINVLLMLGVVAAIAVPALARLNEPRPVAGGTVMLIAAVGLLINLAVAWVLTRGERTMNVRGALLHVMGDVLGSVAALAAGVTIYFTGWTPIDPMLSLFVSLLILISAARLLRDIARVLMEGVPRDLDAAHVAAAMRDLDGVRDVHDLHIWTLSSRTRAVAAHVDLDALERWREVFPNLQAMLRERFGITHCTLQPEDASALRHCTAGAVCGATAGNTR